MRREQSSFTPLQLLIKGTESEVTAVNAQLCVHFFKRMFPLININFAANVTFKKKNDSQSHYLFGDFYFLPLDSIQEDKWGLIANER